MSGRIFFGIILVVLGAAFLLDQLQIIQFGELMSTYWPVILIVIGAYNLLKRNIKTMSGFILIFIGVFFQLRELEILPSNMWQYFWPILLIIIGLGIIFSRNANQRIPYHSEDRIDHFVLFSGLNTRNNSSDFKGGSVVAVFGGAEIDLRNAHIVANEAQLDLTTAFGGIDITVPENWKVIANGLPLFGGWENKTILKKADISGRQDIPVLRVRCIALFGGVEIKN